jgi:hypothetical protein
MPLKQHSARTHILGVGDACFFAVEQGDDQARVDHYDFGIAGFDADDVRSELSKLNLKFDSGNSKESFKFFDPWIPRSSKRTGLRRSCELTVASGCSRSKE